MIYNKKLGISDEMINNEEDMDVVMGWRREIEAEIVEFKKLWSSISARRTTPNCPVSRKKRVPSSIPSAFSAKAA